MMEKDSSPPTVTPKNVNVVDVEAASVDATSPAPEASDVDPNPDVKPDLLLSPSINSLVEASMAETIAIMKQCVEKMPVPVPKKLLALGTVCDYLIKLAEGKEEEAKL